MAPLNLDNVFGGKRNNDFNQIFKKLDYLKYLNISAVLCRFFLWKPELSVFLYLYKIKIMKVILEIENKRASFVMELLKSFKYVHILSEIKNPEKEKIIHELDEAFSDIKLHAQGKKKLKTAKALLNEL